MRPFGAMYFVKENRTRSLLLIFMFVLTYVTYLGGLYISNIDTMFDYNLEYMKKYAIIHPTTTDTDGKDFEKVKQKVADNDKITSFQSGVVSSILSKSLMGFNNGYPQISFRSVSDFQAFCDTVGIRCNFDKLKKGSFITTRLGANNRGMKIGDKLKQLEDENVYGTYTLDEIIEGEGYHYFYIDNGEGGENYSIIVLADNMQEEEFRQYLATLEKDYDVYITGYQRMKEDLQRQFNSFHIIFLFIVVLLAVVMALVINAAFAGMYQHREPEFAVYRAIGMSRASIVKKVLKELLLVDVLGVVAGGCVLFLGIYLLNHLYLIPHGWKLFYYDSLALLGMALCNIMVLVVIMITRSRQLLKADICRY